jgi:hypothetical protein
VILGVLVLMTGLFLSDSALLFFQLLPRSILGVILFFAGIELALVVEISSWRDIISSCSSSPQESLYGIWAWLIWQDYYSIMALNSGGSGYETRMEG